ncbi:MAG: hypothetical protein HYT21_02175 [Candidatus Nealsonbacteria bacterium]|nr:hypothetical protein [Candidatus Nealsonbacteria bacterium]
MQIFELHFNPKSAKDRVFDTFIYEPENLYEKRLGNLYMAGELEKQLLRNPRFLSEFAGVMKDEYYSSQLKNTPEKNLTMALKKANDFLDEEAKRGNVGWLGNLNFALINYNDFAINFTKTGNIKIVLIRRGDFLDIGENLETQSDQTYSLKVFGNIASGKLAPADKLLVLTEEAFSVISQNGNFLKQLDATKDEKGLKEIISINKALFAEISGICLLMLVSQNTQPKRALTFRKELPMFSFRELLMKSLRAVKIPQPPQPRIISWKPKQILLVAFLILLLALSFIFFKK